MTPLNPARHLQDVFAIDHIDGVSDAYWLATGYRRLGGRVMRVDMAERLSAVIRAAAREGQFKISDEMMSLAGATRDQMAEIILDLNYIKVDEIPSEDPEKPATLVFERKKRGPKPSGDKPRGAKPAGGNKNRGKAKPNRSKPPQVKKEKEPDPLSPFAVLANLKSDKK